MVKRNVRLVKNEWGRYTIVLPDVWERNLTVDEILDGKMALECKFVKDGRLELISKVRGAGGTPFKVKSKVKSKEPSAIVYFLEDYCQFKKDEWTPTEELYSKYLEYAQTLKSHRDNPEAIWSKISFAKRLHKIHGIHADRRTVTGKGKMGGWCNLILKPTDTQNI